MGMRIDKPGDRKMLRPINDLVRTEILRNIAHSHNPIISNSNIGNGCCPIGQKCSNILDQRIQCNLSYASPRYSFCSALSSSMVTSREFSLIFAISTLISSGIR